MEYVRTVDFAALEESGSDAPLIQTLLDHASGAKHCSIKYIKTPVGKGSPAGLHVHAVDQIFYILAGTMSIEIEGARYECGPGSLVVFPAGVPHRNWNNGRESTVHLAVNAPLPDPAVPFATSL